MPRRVEPTEETVSWILRGCQHCVGDLYETYIEDGDQYFQCLQCGREHWRKVGMRVRPKLVMAE